jgi:hypothetical protein
MQATISAPDQQTGTRYGSTNELADFLRVEPGTIRTALSLKGHYLGLVPLKMGNRLLRWNMADAQALLDQKKSA